MKLRRSKSAQDKSNHASLLAPKTPTTGSQAIPTPEPESDSTLSSVPSDVQTPSPLKRKRDDGQPALQASSSPELTAKGLDDVGVAKKQKLDFSDPAVAGSRGHRTRSRVAQVTAAFTAAAGGVSGLRASTPASVASASPRRAARGGRGGTRGGGKSGRGGRDGKDFPGRGRKGNNDPGWPTISRELPDTDETLALKKRRHELRQFYNHLATVHGTAMEILAARDLTKVVRKKSFHTSVPGYQDTLDVLQQKLKERNALLEAEYKLKLQLEMNEWEQKKGVIQQQFKVRNAQYRRSSHC